MARRERCGAGCFCQRCAFLNRTAVVKVERRERQAVAAAVKPAAPKVVKPRVSARPHRKRPARPEGAGSRGSVAQALLVPRPMQDAIIAGRNLDGLTWKQLAERSGTSPWVCRRIVGTVSSIHPHRQKGTQS